MERLEREHLDWEALARLVDEEPTRAERAHLDTCEECSSELAALMEQTEALGTLPAVTVPAGDWEDLEARLRSEGLIRPVDSGAPSFLGGWGRTNQVAAAVLLFLGGTAFGKLLAAGPVTAEQYALEGVVPASTIDRPPFQEMTDLGEAEALLEETGRDYLNLLVRVSELRAAEEGVDVGVDPVQRYAAFRALRYAMERTLAEAPFDPLLNEWYILTLSEERSMADQVGRLVADGNWH